jgi:N-acetylneuraminic acid mutarotase
MSRQAILNSDGAKVRHVRGNFSPLSQVDAGKAGKATTARPTPNEAPWTNIADYPEPTMDAGAALVDGKLYSFGGVPGPGVITNHAFVYDPASLSWSAISPVPVDGLENPAVETIDGLIYITGGWNSDGSNNTTTWAYDPGADSYTEVADQPVGLAASGRAVLDGALYTIGGCQDACGFTDVQRYDPGADTWTAVADYPEPISHVGCGAISGALYCAGGTGGSSTTANGYVYDAGADSWTPIADIPIDLWGMGYTAANDTLLLSGGITQGFAVITNEGFSYDPSSDSWTELPASNSTVYRGGSACGFYKLGGSIGGFSPIPQVEQLPGFEECGAATDVPWLSIDTTSATLAPGESVTVRVTMSANVAQPGTYTAGVGIKENTPYSVSPVGVTMHITPPVTWGKLAGTVTGVSCQGESSPLAGATVQVDSWATDWTFETDAQGQYAYWIDVRNNPLSIIAAKDGYKPKFRTVRIRQGQTVTANFALQKAGC